MLRVSALRDQLSAKLFALPMTTRLCDAVDPMTFMLVRLAVLHRASGQWRADIAATEAYLVLHAACDSVVQWDPGSLVEAELVGQLLAFRSVVHDIMTRAGLLPSVNVPVLICEGIACTLRSLLPDTALDNPGLRATGLLARQNVHDQINARVVSRAHISAIVLPLLDACIAQYSPSAASANVALPASPTPLSVAQRVTERLARYINNVDAQYMALSRAEAQVILEALQNQPQITDALQQVPPQQTMQRRLFLD